ncbi:MAG: hypothetical protein UV40_C0004G0009 [Parcubacteria group bacterium GW2011_GWA1_42_7]|nr:MAG: hypothetical protein UV34_C0039G0001 [Parcubacteria group bacterium GW2011_GWB1_42_6]KKS70136.1 MAG: hypothetical protein UV40_C0004G0009 [Parcubacteria group bacterium GW2011_GWA1_42_7]KKS91817.1 MAG: hypothetical protein UV67_C0017G0012 [Parcubacteria group bacterium GW2011_GWC1_43_12]
MCLIVFSGLIFISVLYLVQTNALIAKSFELRSVQKSLEEQKEANQRISVSLTQIQSLSNLEAMANDFNLVPIEKVQYLKGSSGFFAVSR